MARTKQTARRSGRPMQSTFSGANSNDAFAKQVEIYQERGARTIVVEGTAESMEKPNIIHLSFLIEETADSVSNGIKKVGRVIAQVRAKAVALYIPNSHVYSDSISSEAKREEVGYFEKEGEGDDDYKRVGSSDPEGKFILVETRTVYKVKSVVRIYLHQSEEEPVDGDDTTLEKTFSMLCFDLMTNLGLRSFDAPVYELANINELRNAARQDALENAKQKAEAILDALKDESVSLGPPIAVTDVHCNLQDDSQNSFLGNWGNVSKARIVLPKDQLVPSHSTKGGSEEERDPKRARTGEEATKETEDELDRAAAETIFVVPTIRVSACVRALFEVCVQS